MNRALLPLEIEERLLLVDASMVREILGRVPWLPIPRATPQLPGVIAYSGMAIPFFDLACCLGIERKRSETEHITSATGNGPATGNDLAAGNDPVRHRTLVGALNGQYFAMSFDAAREVLRVDESEFSPVHAVPTPFGVAEVSMDGSLATIVDIPELVQDVAGLYSMAPAV